MHSTLLAQSHPTQKALRTATWLSAMGMLAAVWGCRVKRIDPSEPPPSASTSAPKRSPAAARVATEREPRARSPHPEPTALAPETATGSRPAGPAASIAAPSAAPELPPFAATDLPPGVAAAVFSGPGSDPAHTQSLVNAVRHALRALTQESPPLEAAVLATTVVESDPLLNASAGAALRLDGSAELEVSVMDSSGRVGAAAAVRNLQHPVRLAFAAYSSPHHLLVGEGAARLAEWLGLPLHDRRTPRQIATYETLVARFAPGHEQRVDATAWGSAAAGPGASAWRAYLEHPRREAPPEHPKEDAASAAAAASAAPAPSASATGAAAEVRAPGSAAAVAVLVRAGAGSFGGAIETGGTWLALPGSVGAVATPGAALYVAGRGAIALAGPADRLVEGVLARRTYEKLLAYQSARAAAEWALEQAKGLPISIAVMDARSIVVLSNAPTAWAKADPHETTSAAPVHVPVPAAPRPLPPPPAPTVDASR